MRLKYVQLGGGGGRGAGVFPITINLNTPAAPSDRNDSPYHHFTLLLIVLSKCPGNELVSELSIPCVRGRGRDQVAH